MKIDEGHNMIERRIITGLIVSKRFLDELAPILKIEHLQSSSAKLLTQWILAFYEKRNDTPKGHIQDIYLRKLREDLNKDTAVKIEKILQSLNDDYDEGELNIDYLIDESTQYLRQRALFILGEDVQDLAEKGELNEAEASLTNFQTVIRLSTNSVNIKDPDPKTIKKAFTESREPLIKFPGRLGYFINHEFVREGLVGFMAPEKHGKTFMLMELAIRALRSGSNIVFFQAGDMSERQMLRRIGVRLIGRSDLKRYCNSMLIPILDCQHNQFGTCKIEDFDYDAPFEGESINDLSKKGLQDYHNARRDAKDYEPCTICQKNKNVAYKPIQWYKKREKVDPLMWKEAYKAFIKLQKYCKRNFHLISYPTNTMRMIDVKSELAVLENREGWSPDVIIIDYADIMQKVGKDEREKQNNLWMEFRALSQKRRCLLITATQSDAASYGKGKLSIKNFSEDKRKYSHVTCMFGLQATGQEKKLGIMKVNKIVARDDFFEESTCVKVLQKLEMGRPFLGSF